MDRLYITEFGKKHFEKHQIKGVLFDMDGVIIDTEKLYVRFWAEAGRALGFPMYTEHGMALRSLNHADAQKLFNDWFGPTADYTAIRAKRIELMTVYIEEHGVDPKPGIQEILDCLAEQGIPYCIATASHPDIARKYLTQIGVNDRFQHIVTAYDVKKGKPEPDIYLAAAAKIGIAPENCIAVEDSKNGLLSASRAGVAPIIVPDQDEPTEEMLKYIAARAESLADLRRLF